jgi:gamma-glutamyl hydrolase
MEAYVRYLESSGAKVVPILYNETDDETLEKLERLDGVLFPGGGGDYVAKGKFITEKVIEMNQNGHFFPLWGTCLGFERLAEFTASEPSEVLEVYGSVHKSLNLDFKVKPEDSLMFCGMGNEAVDALKSDLLTYNNHQYSV